MECIRGEFCEIQFFFLGRFGYEIYLLVIYIPTASIEKKKKKQRLLWKNFTKLSSSLNFVINVKLNIY